MKYDFSGYATKNDLKCSDGRVIRKDAFKGCDGKTVPLVWQHMHDDPSNILGHALLENREDGVYAYCKLNDTEAGKNVKALVQHGDIRSLSIFANQLRQNVNDVVHGVIREVSTVLTGANPGAMIDNVSFAHGDGTFGESETEAIIRADEQISTEEVDHIEHADKGSDGGDKTVGEIFDSMTEEQKNVVYYMMSQIDGGSVEHSDEGGKVMKHNVFEGSGEGANTTATLTHAEFLKINEQAKKMGSLKQAFMAHKAEMADGTPGVDYGITNIELLFPDYRNVRNEPDMIKRDDAWVAGVIAGTNKTPFARIRTMTVDVTEDAARARGYKKGHLKKEEVIKMAKRVTGPTTIYKKQRLDRDDIIDITDMDIVSYLKAEMQMMLREELARAILIGDGRDISSDDKIDEQCIRPIAKEEELYAFHLEVDMEGDDENDKYLSLIDQIADGMEDYRGSGSPTLYTTKRIHNRLRRVKDKIGRKIYESDAALCEDLGVGQIVDVSLMEGYKTDGGNDVFGIIVNLKDYTVGTNRGGQTTFFDDFDIDYNQYKYLYETRLSGALTRPDSAVVIEVKPNGISLMSSSRTKVASTKE